MVQGEAVASRYKKGRVKPAFFDRAPSRGVARRLRTAVSRGVALVLRTQRTARKCAVRVCAGCCTQGEKPLFVALDEFAGWIVGCILGGDHWLTRH